MSAFPTQQLLYQALLRQEEAAFEHLYRLMYGRLARYVYEWGGTAEQARELVHETVIALLYKLKQGQYQWRDEAELTTYVTAIGRNIWRYQQRQTRQTQSLDTVTLPDDPPDEDEFSFENRRVAVVQGLAQLGEKCRQAIQLYYWEHLPMHQIAQRLGWANEAVARKEKSRCLKTLRSKLPPQL